MTARPALGVAGKARTEGRQHGWDVAAVKQKRREGRERMQMEVQG